MSNHSVGCFLGENTKVLQSFNKQQKRTSNSKVYHLTHHSDFYVVGNTKDNGRVIDSFYNEYKPCIVTNEMVHMVNVDIEQNVKAGDENYVLHNLMQLSKGALKIKIEENAGGNSMSSEVLSFEILNRVYGASLEATEMDIQYCPISSKKTDYSVKIGGNKYGVSVTRAFNYLGAEKFTREQAKHLLKKKLNGVIHSSKNVVREFRWGKQILHIFTDSKKNARILRSEYRKLKSKDYRINTIVVVTVAEKSDYLFTKFRLKKLLMEMKQKEYVSDSCSDSNSDSNSDSSGYED